MTEQQAFSLNPLITTDGQSRADYRCICMYKPSVGRSIAVSTRRYLRFIHTVCVAVMSGAVTRPV